MEMKPISNIETLLRNIALNDDSSAFCSLFELYYAPLCLFAKRYVEDKAAREDIVQDVFVAIWEKRKLISFTTSAKNYLISCVKNSSLNYLRKQSYFQDYQDKWAENPPVYEEDPDSLYNLQELRDLLTKALSKLPETYRLAFTMSRFKDKSVPEIADIMQVSTRTVERYRNRAMEILKEELKDYLPLILLLI
jgi:RNA polymerase sigma-70 factor (ECF subfamily)